MLRGSALVEIIERVAEIEADEGVRQRFREMVRQVGAEHGFALPDRNGRVLYARRLLDMGISRPSIRDRLMAQFDIKRTQAYREIDAALKLSHFCTGFGTANRSNETVENHLGAGDGRSE